MNDISELKKRAEKLARQIGLIQTEFRIDDVNTKIDELGNVIKELRHDNDRLAHENEGLNVSLTSLISAVEDSWFSARFFSCAVRGSYGLHSTSSCPGHILCL